MQFGLHFLLAVSHQDAIARKYREAIEQAVVGESLGFESVWPAEQHFDPRMSSLSCPMLLLAAIAARTTRLRLGTGIVQLPLAHPLRLAEELATLDVLSNGRLELGVGRGSNPMHFAGFGVPTSESRARFEESIEFIRAAWDSERFSFDGRFWSVRDLRLVPRPVQARPRMRVAANSPETASWAGRAGFPVLCATNVNPFPKLRQMIAHYHQGRAAGGHAAASPDDVSLLVPTYVGVNKDAARREFEPSILHAAQLAARLGSAALTKLSEAERVVIEPLVERMRQLDFDTVDETIGVVGSPQDCAARLAQIRSEFAPGRIIGWFNFGDQIAHPLVLDSMTRFAREVMPHFA
jgi:alkanesulfonate monooxygenase SsuD/methylene tetrahydromethanopterin reductase-like flavin-dependent oxidoreductase (luciferase family)